MEVVVFDMASLVHSRQFEREDHILVDLFLGQWLSGISLGC